MGKGTLEERGSEYGEVGESFLNACDENEGEEEAEGIVCGLVAAVSLAEYRSMSATNSGIWN